MSLRNTAPVIFPSTTLSWIGPIGPKMRGAVTILMPSFFQIHKRWWTKCTS